MKSIKTLSIFLLSFALLFSSCEDDELKKPCAAIVIENDAFFDNGVTLKNHCNEGDGVDYIVNTGSVYDFLSVEGDLIIEEGTTIVFENSGGLVIETTGSIVANGTAANPIVLKGKNETQRGSWRGIMVYSASIDNSLAHTTIKNAGGDSFNSNNDRGNLVVYSGAKIAINNCTFSYSATHGINADYNDSHISSLVSNYFSNNDIPMLLRASNADVVDVTNRFSDNTNAYVRLRKGSKIVTAKTWQAIEIPYQLATSANGLFKLQEVGTGGQLTINPGTSILFEAQAGFDIDGTGAFIAKGTANNRIKLKGAAATSGYWDGIQFNFTQNPLNEISFADIEHNGSGDGAIYMWSDPVVNINNVAFKDISTCAFYDAPKTSTSANNPKLTTSNNTYTNVTSQYCKGS